MDADLILLGHGSRRGTATDEGLRETTARLQRLAPAPMRVRMAAWEFTEPSLQEVVTQLTEEGSHRIMVVPFFLFDGKHIKEEIPEVLDELRHHFPQIDLGYAHTLGFDPRLVQLATERAHQGLTGDLCAQPCNHLRRNDLGVVFVNRGSHLEYDPGDRLRQLASQMSAELGVPVTPSQAEYASPTIGEAIDLLVKRGKSTIVVLPYIFFPGKVLNVNILPPVEDARRRYPQATFHIAPTLGVDDRIVALAWQRAQEALELIGSHSS